MVKAKVKKTMLQTMVKSGRPLIVTQYRRPIMRASVPPIIEITKTTYMNVSQQLRG